MNIVYRLEVCTVPVPIGPPQIRYGQAWDKTRPSALTYRQLTAGAMARS
jgi:hypothetical protein